jgi:hypothetical protein
MSTGHPFRREDLRDNMGNVFSAFTNEVFKPLVTLLIPGAIALSPYYVALLWKYPNLRDLVGKNHTETSWILVLVMLSLGLLIEDLGSQIETRFDDQADKSSRGSHMRNWYAYLRTAFIADPVGRRYIRTLVTHLKFELGLGCSMIFAAIGIVWLGFLGLSVAASAVLFVGAVLTCWWAFWEAKQTHKLLASNRSNLLDLIRIVK